MKQTENTDFNKLESRERALDALTAYKNDPYNSMVFYVNKYKTTVEEMNAVEHIYDFMKKDSDSNT